MSTRQPSGRKSGNESPPGPSIRADDLLPPPIPPASTPPDLLLPQQVVPTTSDLAAKREADDLPPPVVPNPPPAFPPLSLVPDVRPPSLAARTALRTRVGLTRETTTSPQVPSRTDARDKFAPSMAPEGTLDPASAVIRATPPWLVSLLVHVLALIILALCYLPSQVADPFEIQVTSSQDQATPLMENTLASPTQDIADLAAELPLADESVEEPVTSLPIFDVRLQPLGANNRPPVAPIGRALSGREPGAKRRLLAAYGGTAETERAVRLGLRWLKKNQRRNGTWSLTGPYENGASLENETAATAMAMLAFLGAGHTHLDGEYRNVVTRGARALTEMQDADGNFYHATIDNHRLYSQALATIAVCELYGMTRDDRFHGAAQGALDYAARTQTDNGQGGGGWRYVPGQDIDTSVTGWFAMALQSGKMAGLEVSDTALEKVSLYLDQVTEDGVHYRYRTIGPPSLSMTAEALLCRQYLGWKRGDSRLSAGVSYLLKNPIEWKPRGRSVYYWYYATQVLHHMSGDEWDRWNEDLRQVLPRHQRDRGAETGSWDPAGDEHGDQVGRLYTTCLSICMLEVYYRHLPIEQGSGIRDQGSGQGAGIGAGTRDRDKELRKRE